MRGKQPRGERPAFLVLHVVHMDMDACSTIRLQLSRDKLIQSSRVPHDILLTVLLLFSDCYGDVFVFSDLILNEATDVEVCSFEGIPGFGWHENKCPQAYRQCLGGEMRCEETVFS